MLNMRNNSAITICINVFICLSVFNFVNCLSSREARTLTRKFELMRNGMENKLISAMVEIDDIRDSVRNCSCREPNVTQTEQTQTFVERPTIGIQDEMPTRSRFAEQNQTQLQVRGGWTDWAHWEQCSHTCGIGLSLRKRECSNQYPGPNVNPCIGEYTDVKICMIQECQDFVHGGWTDWAPWEQCSVTCGIGLSLRKRECSNPYPGQRGNPCIGAYTDVKMCMIKECVQLGANGGWSDWSQWGQCSKVCGTGILKRQRYCSNPYPGPYGNPCVGDNTDVDTCMLKECQSADPTVFFNVDSPLESMVNGVVVFKNKVETISGIEYNTTTGKYTCRKPGLYHFFVRFQTVLTIGTDKTTYCQIIKNGYSKAIAHHLALTSSISNTTFNFIKTPVLAFIYLSLDAGDTVWVGGCNGWASIVKGLDFDFVGALITAF